MSARSCGRYRRRVQPLGLVAALALATVRPAPASEVTVHVSGYGFPDSAAFDLHVVREDLAGDYDDSAGDETLRLRRLGISLYEALGSSVRGGVRLGYTGFSQSGRPATAGLDPTGYFAELDFAGAWPNDGRLQAALEAGWRYTSVDDSDDTSEVELDWHTLELRPGLRFAPTPRLALAVGASLIAVDGSERTRGASPATTDISAAERGGGFLALEYYPRPRDVITLRLRDGNPEGLSLAFEHRY